MNTPEVNGNPNVVKYTGPTPTKPRGEHLSIRAKGAEFFQNNGEMRNIINNLNGTDAGCKAREMAEESSKKYGTEPGMSAAEIWNPYAKEHGGKQISNSISVVDAMNSISSYAVREQTESRRAQAEELRANSETGQKPEQGI